MRAYPDTVRSSTLYADRVRALAFAKTVARAGFLIPVNQSPSDTVAANVAHQKGWVYQVRVGDVTGYKANLTVAELKALDV